MQKYSGVSLFPERSCTMKIHMHEDAHTLESLQSGQHKTELTKIELLVEFEKKIKKIPSLSSLLCKHLFVQ